jgi:O-antigen/teichoic acid export membrane protein
MAFLQLQYPVMRALLPAVVRGSGAGTVGWRLTAVVVLCVAPCVLVGVAAPQVLDTWLGTGRAGEAGPTVLRLLLAAVAINALYNLVYQHILAAGAGGVVLAINLIGLAVSLLTLVLGVPACGVVAGGFAWLANAVIQITGGMLWWWFGRHPGVNR